MHTLFLLFAMWQHAIFYGQNVSSGGSAPLSLLDNTPAAIFACSASHSLKQSYSGALIRIQRASDSTQTDVGQNSDGSISQGTINTFCSGTTCGVTTCYDESGSGNNATQSTFANMPIIYTSGAVVKTGPNSKVAMSFTGSATMNATVNLTGTSVESMTMTNFSNPSGNYQGLLEVSDGTHECDNTTTYVCVFVNSGGATAVVSDFNSVLISQSISYGTAFFGDMYASLTGGTPTIFLALNNGTPTSAGIVSGSFSATTAVIGNNITAGTPGNFTGYLQDLVLFETQSTSTQRTNAHTVESNFFGTP